MYQNWLCSPGRMSWVKGRKPEGCIFCRIARGDKKIPNKILHKNGKFMVIMNIFPYNTGHLQVIPVKHATALEELDDKTVSELFVLVKKCLKLLKKVLGPEGFNIGINQGENVAGASIPHLHIHIVPRYRNDFGFMEIIAKTKVLPESVDETYEKLLKNVKILG